MVSFRGSGLNRKMRLGAPGFFPALLLILSLLSSLSVYAASGRGRQMNWSRAEETESGQDLMETQASMEAGWKDLRETETETEMNDQIGCENPIRTETETEIKEESLVQARDPEVEKILSDMDLEQKVFQMFILTPEQLTGVDIATQAGEDTRSAYLKSPVGGLIYMEQNINSAHQIREMLISSQKIALEITGLPLFLCVDEEGGPVCRVSGRGIADIPSIPDMRSVGETGDPQRASEIGDVIGTYLTDLGFNVNFAPVGDLVSDLSSSAIGRRSFSADPAVCGEMVSAFVQALQKHRLAATVKHFPGQGDVSGDSHLGAVVSEKSLKELSEADLIPFEAGIKAGAELIMAGHLSFQNAPDGDLPASLSPFFLTDLLRGEMGFEGLIITDAMNMGALAEYNSGTASVLAVEAGADLLLMPTNFQAAYDDLLLGVLSGRISMDRIDESVRRIISLKLRLMG